MKKVIQGLLIICLAISLWGYQHPAKDYTLAAGKPPTYSLNPYPSNGATVNSTTPLITWKVFPNGAAIAGCQLILNGQSAEPTLVRESDGIAISYRPAKPLLPGRHSVTVSVTFTGYQPVALSFDFYVSQQAIDPYDALDTAFLQSRERAVLDRINQYRNLLGLNPLQRKPELSLSAQAHSNYMNRNRVAGHGETDAYPGFTGATPLLRAELFGFAGMVGEGIDYGAPGPLAVDRLMDAPYHRLSIVNPLFKYAGAGFSGEFTVINFGGPHGSGGSGPMLYPYPDQQDAKIAWYNAETPNPLAHFGQGRGIFGYPVSLSLHDPYSREFRTLSAVLYDSQGHTVPCYIVDSTLEREQKNHLFLIPASPLTLSTTYRVAVRGEILSEDGQIRPLDKSWSFRTSAVIGIDQLELIQLGGVDQIRVTTRSGEPADLRSTISQNGDTIRQYNAGDGVYTAWGESRLAEGEYRLTITSSILAAPEIYALRVLRKDGRTEVVLVN